MTATDLEKLVRAELTKTGLWQLVDLHKSQFLEFPDGLFAELVLTDGSKQVDVERIGRDLRESVKKQNVELDLIVRSVWTVKTIGDPPYGSQTGRWRIPVTITSGVAMQAVEVDVLYEVVLDIKRRIAERGLDKNSAVQAETSAVKEIVKEFVEMELSLGGESYWDPVQHCRREINGSALAYLFMHTPVAQHLGIDG